MVNRYDLMEKLANIGGLIGRALVFIGMVCGCALMWFFVIRLIQNN